MLFDGPACSSNLAFILVLQFQIDDSNKNKIEWIMALNILSVYGMCAFVFDLKLHVGIYPSGYVAGYT